MSAPAWEGHRLGDAGYRRLAVALFAAGIATFTQLYSVQAVLPGIAKDFDVSPATAALTVSIATAGVTISVLPWASIADHIGRARAMTIALVVAAVLGLASPFVPTFGLLLAFRFAEGLALGALPALAIAYIAEEVHVAYVAVVAGTYVSGNAMGGLIGRLIAGPVSEWFDWQRGVALSALVSAIAAVVFIIAAPRVRGFTSVKQRRMLGADVPRVGRILIGHLKDPVLLAIFAHAFLLMGIFIAAYNFLTFRIEAPPFSVPVSLSSLIFLAYLAGSWSSGRAGRLTARFGRYRSMLGCATIMMLGALATMIDWLPAIVFGLVLLTGGYFAAHAVASAWIGHRAPTATAQASALYTLSYYAGASLVGWVMGFVFSAWGWQVTALTLVGLCLVAMTIARLVLKRADAISAP